MLSLPVGVLLSDPVSRKVTTANDAAVALLGHDRSALRERRIYELAAPELRERALACATKPNASGEWKLLRRDGSSLWVHGLSLIIDDRRVGFLSVVNLD